MVRPVGYTLSSPRLRHALSYSMPGRPPWNARPLFSLLPAYFLPAIRQLGSLHTTRSRHVIYNMAAVADAHHVQIGQHVVGGLVLSKGPAPIRISLSMLMVCDSQRISSSLIQMALKVRLASHWANTAKNACVMQNGGYFWSAHRSRCVKLLLSFDIHVLFSAVFISNGACLRADI